MIKPPSEEWAVTTLEHVVDILDSKRVPVKKSERDKRPGIVPYYGATGLAGWIDKPIFNEELLLLGEDGAPFLDPIKPKSYIIRGPAWVNNHAHVLRAIDGLMSNEFLKYQLDWASYAGHVTGTTRLKLTQRAMRKLPILLPGIAAQKRIVAAIEEHFSRLDAVDIAVEAAQQKLEALWLSILRETCTGSWPETALSELIVSLKNGVFVSRPSVDPPGMPIYRISAVRPLTLRVSDFRYAHPVPDKADSYAVDIGDVLFTRYSGNPQYVGAAAVVPPEGAGVLHPDKLIRVIADRERVLPEWIAAYVTAGKGRSEIEKRLKTTAGQVGISGSQLKTVPIAVPPLSYQEQAVAKIGLMLSEQERTRQQLAELAKKSQALRRSILANAFSGRLVPQDPNDEPASALLGRIHVSQDPKGN